MSDHRAETTKGFRLPPELRSAVAAMAEAADQSPDWVVQRALRQYLAGEGRDLLAAARGRADFDAGLREDFDDVLAEVDAMLRGSAA